jgi:hypothetical protein
MASMSLTPEGRRVLRENLQHLSDSRGIRLWIGNQPNPDDRAQIVVSQADYVLIPSRGSRGAATVTDQLTGKVLRIRRASCGLPHCMCALEFAVQA